MAASAAAQASTPTSTVAHGGSPATRAATRAVSSAGPRLGSGRRSSGPGHPVILPSAAGSRAEGGDAAGPDAPAPSGPERPPGREEGARPRRMLTATQTITTARTAGVTPVLTTDWSQPSPAGHDHPGDRAGR